MIVYLFIFFLEIHYSFVILMVNSSSNSSSETTDWIALLKTLSSKPRLHILFYLFIYSELSLSKLTEHLGKSKNTTLYHMKRLVEQDLVEEYDRPLSSSIKPEKCYRMNPDFYQKMFLPFDQMAELSKTELIDRTKQLTKWNALLFETMREMLKELRDFYRFQGNQLDKGNDVTDAEKLHQNFDNPRDLIPLSEAGFKQYMKNYQELAQKTQQILKSENQSGNAIIRPYLVFNTVLPIQKILEYKHKHNSEK